MLVWIKVALERMVLQSWLGSQLQLMNPF